MYGYMASDSERGNLLPPHRLLFRLAARVLLHTVRIEHPMDCVAPVVEHRLERAIAQWIHHDGSIRRPITTGVDATPPSYILHRSNGTAAFLLNVSI